MQKFASLLPQPLPPQPSHPSSPALSVPSFITSPIGSPHTHSISLASSQMGSLWVPGLPPPASFHGLGRKSDGSDRGLPGTQFIMCPCTRCLSSLGVSSLAQ